MTVDQLSKRIASAICDWLIALDSPFVTKYRRRFIYNRNAVAYTCLPIVQRYVKEMFIFPELYEKIVEVDGIKTRLYVDAYGGVHYKPEVK